MTNYKLTYYTPQYTPKDTDTLAAFRVTPQPGVPLEEAGLRGCPNLLRTWTTMWTDGLTKIDRYKGRCYDIEPALEYLRRLYHGSVSPILKKKKYL
ncbi:hypothetical protein IFM89_019715 [Coptis chinensis]|uniref:Ribulose bisphosphate carboxylase large chain n=1 Tax=Coptis chinensis TaxID=261450 RepID=A0A835GYF3_9MAGN|nr:hypothetical protein IFM89_019715 [Coptis chinensis]